MIKKVTISILLSIAAIFILATTANAGSLTPPAAPANTMYTMTDVFNLSSGVMATIGSGVIPATPSSVVVTFKTLTEIYDAISAQVANLSNTKIASGVSAFGFTGTLAGDTNPAKVFTTATYPGTYDASTLSVGTVKNGTAFGVGATGDYPSSTYPLSGDTGATDAGVGSILNNQEAWTKTGVLITGTMPTNTLSTANDTVSAGYYDATTLSAVDTDLTAANIKSSKTIFGIAGTHAPAALLSTNQTLCSDAAGALISCAGTGQDGESLKGVARSYTDNANSTITDNSTNLIWKKCSEGLSGTGCTTGTISTLTWTNALVQCEADTTAGFTDWRLPNIYELYSIVDFGATSNPFINTTYFPATGTANYTWSSTTYPVPGSGRVSAMAVSFQNGGASYFQNKGTSYYVRCVRG